MSRQVRMAHRIRGHRSAEEWRELLTSVVRERGPRAALDAAAAELADLDRRRANAEGARDVRPVARRKRV